MKTYAVKPSERDWYKKVMALREGVNASSLVVLMTYMIGRSGETEQALEEINANVLALSAELKELKSQLRAERAVKRRPTW